MLLSAGERISMALLSMAIRELGGDAISFTGSQSGIITNDRHVDARIIEVRPFRVQDELARGRVVVIAGYQGVSYRREVTTLGRGGSDTTAVAMAAALGADWCEICSDVDGVYTADPRVVPAAHGLACCRTRRRRSWRKRAPKSSTRKPSSSQRIGHRHLRSSDGLGAAWRRSIVGRHGRAQARAADAGHGSRRGQRARRAGAAGRRQSRRPARAPRRAQHRRQATPCRRVRCAGDGLTLVISRENLHDEDRSAGTSRIDSPRRRNWWTVWPRSARSGAGINATYGTVRRGSAALAAAGVTSGGLATSSFRVTWLVPRGSVETAVRALHREFLEQLPPVPLT